MIMTEPTAELVHVPATRADIEAAMMDRGTDSWTVILEAVGDLARRIADTDFVPADHRGKVGQVAAVILHGRELGLPPMTALAATHVIKGRPSISAEAMRAMILQHGHQIKIVESSSEVCTVMGVRAGDEDWLTVTWSADDARRAGLLPGKSDSNWARYPRQMLAARATAELAKLMFADVIHGMHAIEEMEGEPAAPPVPERVTVAEIQQQAAEARTPDRRSSDLPTSDDRPPETHDSPAAPPASEAGAPVPTAPAPASDPTPSAGAGTPPVVPAPATPQAAEAGAVDPQPAPASAPSVEDQQAEIRKLSEEKRRLAAAPETEPPTADEPVDAEVIDTEDRKPISPAQRGYLMANFKRLGIEDRTMRLSYSMALTGRDDLESSNQLTFAQASNLINQLEMCPDLDALEQRVNGQEPLT